MYQELQEQMYYQELKINMSLLSDDSYDTLQSLVEEYRNMEYQLEVILDHVS